VNGGKIAADERMRATMKSLAVIGLAMLGTIPVLAQDQAGCKIYFQVLRGEPGAPGLHAELDSRQKGWWENEGKKKYAGLCLSGADMSGEKPRFIVIWSNSKTIGQSSVPGSEIYGQQPATLQATSPAARIYQPRWDKAQVTVINVKPDGTLLLPPVYFETDSHSWIFAPDSRKVLEAIVKYLRQEQVFVTEVAETGKSVTK
jgi:hypothetical protein